MDTECGRPNVPLGEDAPARMARQARDDGRGGHANRDGDRGQEVSKPATMSIARSASGMSIEQRRGHVVHPRAWEPARWLPTPADEGGDSDGLRPTMRAMRAPTIMREARSWPRRPYPGGAQREAFEATAQNLNRHGSHTRDEGDERGARPPGARRRRDSGMRWAFTAAPRSGWNAGAGQ